MIMILFFVNLICSYVFSKKDCINFKKISLIIISITIPVTIFLFGVDKKLNELIESNSYINELIQTSALFYGLSVFNIGLVIIPYSIKKKYDLGLTLICISTITATILINPEIILFSILIIFICILYWFEGVTISDLLFGKMKIIFRKFTWYKYLIQITLLVLSTIMFIVDSVDLMQLITISLLILILQLQLCEDNQNDNKE